MLRVFVISITTSPSFKPLVANIDAKLHFPNLKPNRTIRECFYMNQGT